MAPPIAPVRPIQPLPAFAAILREEDTFGTGNDQQAADRLNSSFDRLMLQSGLEISPSMFLLLSMCAAISLAGLVFVIQENLLTTSVGFMLGAVLPVAGAIAARASRQKRMMDQMPPMVDELARAAKTGRSLEQCFAQVAEDTAAPLGDELRLCARKMDLGMSMRLALEELPERTGLVSLNILSMALSVHQASGGDLVSVLERLSRTIRERIQYIGRLRAATAASRATAILMVVLPPGILAFFVFRDPAYFTNLMSSSWGRSITIIAFVLDIIGVLWVMRILKNSQSS